MITERWVGYQLHNTLNENETEVLRLALLGHRFEALMKSVEMNDPLITDWLKIQKVWGLLEVKDGI